MNTSSNLVPVPLVFDAEVSSKTASVRDKIPMNLSQDLRIGDFVVRKGTPATVTITQVDRSGIGGAPGILCFEADDLHPESGPIPLQGGATRDGEAKPPNGAILIQWSVRSLRSDTVRTPSLPRARFSLHISTWARPLQASNDSRQIRAEFDDPTACEHPQVLTLFLHFLTFLCSSDLRSLKFVEIF